MRSKVEVLERGREGKEEGWSREMSMNVHAMSS